MAFSRNLEPVNTSQRYTFVNPTKRINEGQDVSSFLISYAYRDILAFITQLNRSIFPSLEKGTETDQNVKIFELDTPLIAFSSPVVQLRNLLKELDEMIDEVPLDQGPRRFGNVSFRKWCELLEERTQDLLHRYLPPAVKSIAPESGVDAATELSAYLIGSFGSSQRLDYGTGHELSFLAFLGGIWKLGGFNTEKLEDEARAIVLGVFQPFVARLFSGAYVLISRMS